MCQQVDVSVNSMNTVLFLQVRPVQARARVRGSGTSGITARQDGARAGWRASVTKQQLSVQSPRRLPPVRKRPLPVPGERLRRAVDTVLAGLTDDVDFSRLDEVLRTALAWTAASGDTCRIATAVRQVRDARISLGHADTEHARTALLAARDDLSLVPNQRAMN
jgi:hypothetical protein